jgi:hypothetical protein
MKERKEGTGITWLKMDLGVEMVSDTPGTVTEPSDLSQWEMTQLEHPFLAMEVTDKGIAMLEHCRNARQLHGQRTLRRRYPEFSGAGKPFA